MKGCSLAMALTVILGAAMPAVAQDATNYRVLATTKTSTMQKEMQEAAAAGYRFAAVMGGETSFGGNEVVVLMQKIPNSPRFDYRLLATSKTSTMEKELQQAAAAGFQYVGQTVFNSAFGGDEVAIIVERDSSSTDQTRFEYKLFATNKTSTLQKEMQGAGENGYQTLGMTVGKTAMGGNELVVITRRKAR